MANEEQTLNPQRRTGPHAPLPTPPPATATGLGVAAVATPSAEDPRARAKARAAELLDHLGGTFDQQVDDFYIDPRIIPDGWSYEWKRHTIYGAQDPSYQVSVARTGWEAVPASRHPEMMPEGFKGQTIERKGMILMERPAEVTDAVKAAELRKARLQVRQKEEQVQGAPAGQNTPFERDNKGKPIAIGIKKSFGHEPIPIPKE